MSDRLKTFDLCLRKTIREPLRAQGFAFDGSRTFRRSPNAGPIRQIINFQLGQRSYEGMFAVNLGVYIPSEANVLVPIDLDPNKAMPWHCVLSHTKRLGKLLPPKFPTLAALPYFGAFFGPQDVWWCFSADATETNYSLSIALATLEGYGFSWLKSMTPGENSEPAGAASVARMKCNEIRDESAK